MEAAGGEKLDPAGYSQTGNYETKFSMGIDLAHWVGAAPMEKDKKAD